MLPCRRFPIFRASGLSYAAAKTAFLTANGNAIEQKNILG